MKKTILSIALGILAVSVGNSAFAEGYNRAGLSYDLETMSGDEDSKSLNGFGLSYTHGFSVTHKFPMYVETGLKMYMSFYGDKIGSADFNITKMTFAVPVNCTYKFPFAADKMSLSPYVGLNFKINALAKEKVSHRDGSESISLFKKEAWDANVFQMGWHIGVNYQYSCLYAGVSFGTDFIRFAPGVNTSNFALTVGYCF